MSDKITGKAIREFYDRIVPGTKMVCLQNQKIPSNEGRCVVVDIVGKSFLQGSDTEGMPFRLRVPTRVADVVDLTEDTITYTLMTPARTCTWRVLP